MDEPDRDTRSDAAKREEAILAFWRDRAVFQQSLEKPAPHGDFVFYEGPPTANGMPGVHHLESRAFKDAIPRYKTMRGYRVRRRGGWDTHGLPVELEVEKKHGFTGKQDIEAYGVAEFNAQCRESVLSYIREWQRFSDRMGYWVDQENAYFTFDPKYMESLWSILKKVDNDGLLYKDYRVLPWCPVCGTALSSHELAQGYEDVKDLSLTVKFELADEPGTFVLAWTTTPWTLPGNVALAVGEDIEYVKVERSDGQKFILAEKIFTDLFDSRTNSKNPIAIEMGTVYAQRVEGGGEAHQTPRVIDRMKGSQLVGKKYRPLYPFAEALASETEKPKFVDAAYRIHAADFVTTDSGTGIVHTAVMYGQDDFELGQKVGLPKVHLVGPDGRFLPGTGFLEGRYVHEQDENGKPTLAVEIVDDLKRQGAYFAQENYKHTYPHCWRSKNRLIYYARDSWYIRMTALKEQLLTENAQITWEPAHIREGRMGEWLANVRDWAVSRERYWGTPLPVWQSADGGERVVIGSVEELKARTKTNRNRFLAMRHAQAHSNTNSIVTNSDDPANTLTDAGRAQASAAGAQLADAGITRIYTSPLPRARETAALVAAALGLPESAIEVDTRLREFDFGELSGKPFADFAAHMDAADRSVRHPNPGGESYVDVKCRLGEALYAIDAAHAGETILLVTHGAGIEALVAVAEGADDARYSAIVDTVNPDNASVSDLSFVPLPHDAEYRLDLHRPFIDDVVLIGDSGAELHRVKEVLDVWFDSGAMPFAQDHYPFENREWIEGAGYPADFISEAIDQTRGWFYTLLAVGVLMGKGRAYRNVISLGHLLDEHGQKMSKSKGNIIEPMAAMDRYGADTLRFWMYSVNQPGDSKSFDEKTVKEATRVISWFENSVKFYELFADTESVGDDTPQAIDRWMLARVDATVLAVTAALDQYDLYTATRTTGTLVEDLSQWYVRRIRDRAREGDAAALATLRATLRSVALLLAPFAPFVAEWAWGILRNDSDKESVHLADWPQVSDERQQNGYDMRVLPAEMTTVRDLASQALKLRNQAGIPVRQPLASLTIPNELSEELKHILAEEVNVEAILVGDTLALDTVITDELRVKGDERIMQRAVAEARKAEGLDPKEQATVDRREDGPYAAELSTGTVRFALVRA